MSSLTNVVSLLNSVISDYPKDLPRSKLEIIKILGDLKPMEEVWHLHEMRMQTVNDDKLRETCTVVTYCLINATRIALELIEWASRDSVLPSGPSALVLEALTTIQNAFRQFESLADNFGSRPKLFKDCCFEYLRDCYTYSIKFQRLLYREDECEHLDFYEGSLQTDFETSFKVDSVRDFVYPGSMESYERRKQTLSDCIQPADQIAINCHLTEQPGKPVCPQFYRNPGPYGQELLRNMNHPSNEAYFMEKYSIAMR